MPFRSLAIVTLPKLEETKMMRFPFAAVDLRSRGKKASVRTAWPKTLVL